MIEAENLNETVPRILGCVESFLPEWFSQSAQFCRFGIRPRCLTVGDLPDTFTT